MDSWVVEPGGAGRLVDVAKEHLGALAVDSIGPLIARGGVLVDGHPGSIAQELRAGAVLTLAGAVESAAPRALELVVRFESAEAIVVDKPAGMHVHPIGEHRAGTLTDALAARAGAAAGSWWTAWRPHTVHRLDRCASGLVLFAKSAAAAAAIRRAFDAGEVARGYRARVVGVVRDDRGTIDAPLARDPAFDYRRAVVPGGARAVTHYRVVARGEATTELALELETGRTHQIRAHLASIGHPIAGDALYVDPPGAPAAAIALHACRLVVALAGGPIACESATPPW
jgi:23S rRNA pseudouridine1911/1915/1917 synthase